MPKGSGQGACFLFYQAPHLERCVQASGNQPLAVGAEGQAPDSTRVSAQGVDVLARIGVFVGSKVLVPFMISLSTSRALQVPSAPLTTVSALASPSDDLPLTTRTTHRHVPSICLRSFLIASSLGSSPEAFVAMAVSKAATINKSRNERLMMYLQNKDRVKPSNVLFLPCREPRNQCDGLGSALTGTRARRRPRLPPPYAGRHPRRSTARQKPPSSSQLPPRIARIGPPFAPN
jgi:hypothetical protein